MIDPVGRCVDWLWRLFDRFDRPQRSAGDLARLGEIRPISFGFRVDADVRAAVNRSWDSLRVYSAVEVDSSPAAVVAPRLGRPTAESGAVARCRAGAEPRVCGLREEESSSPTGPAGDPPVGAM